MTGDAQPGRPRRRSLGALGFAVLAVVAVVDLLVGLATGHGVDVHAALRIAAFGTLAWAMQRRGGEADADAPSASVPPPTVPPPQPPPPPTPPSRQIGHKPLAKRRSVGGERPPPPPPI